MMWLALEEVYRLEEKDGLEHMVVESDSAVKPWVQFPAWVW